MEDKLNKILNTLEHIRDETCDNNRMLREIIAYINLKESQADTENNNDFFRNICANLISTRMEINSFVK